MVRLFIALHIPDEVKERLADLLADVASRGRGIKWVDPHLVHLTLKFLGDTPEARVPAIVEQIRQALAGQAACQVAVRGCGGFPNLNNPRVIWVGLDGAAPAVAMAREINRRLAEIGIEADGKKLSPHLTLGRIKKRDDISDLTNYLQNLNFDAGTVILDRVALVQSTLTPQGPIYKDLQIFELER